MIVNERDIFIFVFFPEKLDVGKKNVIESQSSFDEAVEFYRQLKLNSEVTPSREVKLKLAAKIPAYKMENVVELNPITEVLPQYQNDSRMAAATRELTPKTTTKTFVDNDKEYLIKVLNYGSDTKVFVFSTKDEIVKNFDIIIEPKKLTFHFEDNSKPLIIDHPIEAEKIQIKFA